MKKIKFLSFALAALMLGACSSSDDVVDAGNTGKPQWNAEGKGYINLAISLPTTQGTRANDEWKDGDADEYAVKDATLILFTKADTDPAPVVNSAYDLNLAFNTVGTTTDAITSQAEITAAINQISGSPELSALIVLNNNGLFSVVGSDLQVNGVSQKDATLDNLNDAIKEYCLGLTDPITAWNSSSNGFLMSNALLSESIGGSVASTGPVFTLAPIDASKIFNTEALAKENPAANIYVERAESKVTVSSTAGGTMTETDLRYDIKGWVLDNINKTSKLARSTTDFDNTWLQYNAAGVNNYRMVGSTTVGPNADRTKNYYRVYWGKDYNYDYSETDKYDGALKRTVADGTTIGDDDLEELSSGTTYYPVYCFENTTNLIGMVEKNCTRIIVKAGIKDKEGNDFNTFYTIKGNRKEAWKEEDLKTKIAGELLDVPVIKNLTDGDIDDDEVSGLFTITLVNEDGSTPLASGKVKVGSVTIADASKFTTGATLPADVADIANDRVSDIEYYSEGAAYYSVWVAHFGEDLTPWSNTDAEGSGNTTENIYDETDANDYLGRWGMLRNNWYQITVSGVKTIGSPTVEGLTDETIDKVETYIAFRINILPWAIRTQEAELK